MKYFTQAKNLLAELEKQVASPYTINVLEEWGRSRIVGIIEERREEERKIKFEQTAQVMCRHGRMLANAMTAI